MSEVKEACEALRRVLFQYQMPQICKSRARIFQYQISEAKTVYVLGSGATCLRLVPYPVPSPRLRPPIFSRVWFHLEEGGRRFPAS